MFGFFEILIIAFMAAFFWNMISSHQSIQREQKGPRFIGFFLLLTVAVGLIGAGVLVGWKSQAAMPQPARHVEPQFMDLTQPASPMIRVGTEQAEVNSAVPGPGNAILKESSTPLAVAEVVYHNDGHLISQKSLKTLPEWTNEDRESGPGWTTFVLSSQRFATLDEARQQAATELRTQLAGQFATGNTPVNWQPTIAQLQNAGVIQKECDVAWPLEVGGFTEQVHQVIWQVSFTEAARTAFEKSWQAEEAENRLLQLAAAFGVATTGLALTALFTRRKRGVIQ